MKKRDWCLGAVMSAAIYASGGSTLADQTKIDHYDPHLVFRLYPNGGSDIYCGILFRGSDPSSNPPQMTAEHAYPANWMVLFLGCGDRETTCRRTNTRFNHMEADLHNLWPAYGRLNSARGDKLFGEIPGETRRQVGSFTCDFEATRTHVEPRRAVRGNLARSIFYMHHEYGLSIDAGMAPVLKKWNRADPPNNQERARNAVIERVQGTRNPYIDQPALADR